MTATYIPCRKNHDTAACQGGKFSLSDAGGNAGARSGRETCAGAGHWRPVRRRGAPVEGTDPPRRRCAAHQLTTPNRKERHDYIVLEERACFFAAQRAAPLCDGFRGCGALRGSARYGDRGLALGEGCTCDD